MPEHVHLFLWRYSLPFAQAKRSGGKMANFQRLGAISNTHVGNEFEAAAQSYFEKTGIALQRGFSVDVGYVLKKPHKFDLGSEHPPILVECKSYKWTTGGNSPSAKIRSLNEAMLLFSVAPAGYKKMLFLLRDLRRNLSLAEHYVKTQGHLIGEGVEIWEYDLERNSAERVFPK